MQFDRDCAEVRGDHFHRVCRLRRPPTARTWPRWANELIALYADPDGLLKHARVVGLDEIGEKRVQPQHPALRGHLRAGTAGRGEGRTPRRLPPPSPDEPEVILPRMTPQPKSPEDFDDVHMTTAMALMGPPGDVV